VGSKKKKGISESVIYAIGSEIKLIYERFAKIRFRFKKKK